MHVRSLLEDHRPLTLWKLPEGLLQPIKAAQLSTSDCPKGANFGPGYDALTFLQNGAIYCGIDITPKNIERTRKATADGIASASARPMGNANAVRAAPSATRSWSPQRSV
jgi:hypothetical protein